MTTKKCDITYGILVNTSRFILAAVFLFSGFTKAIDPTGSYYKLQEYLNAFGLGTILPDWITFSGALLLGILEFCLGIYLFWGIRRKISTTVTLLMMISFTLLTLYIAIANPVSDCGCFGEALHLTNWQTFWKNVVLLFCAIIAYHKGNKITRFVSDKFAWLTSLYSALFITILSAVCLHYLPIIDLMPYKVGTDIKASMEIPEGAKQSKYETYFTYKQGDISREFTVDNLPDSTWTFQSSRTELIEKGFEPAIHDFSITLNSTGEDLTDQVLQTSNYTFLLVMQRIELADDGNIDRINDLYDYAQQNGYAFYALTSSPEEEIIKWEDKTGAEYPFCYTDDTTLKTMIRSNPGLMLIKDGTIMQKWSNNNMPDEYQLNGRLEELPIGQCARESTLNKATKLSLWFVIPLMTFLALDKIFSRRKKTEDEEETSTNEEKK